MKSNDQFSEVLIKLLHFSEAILKGDYSKRIIIDVNDDIINQITVNLNQYADELLLNLPHEDGNEKNNIDHFINTISSFANHDFSHKLPITEHGTVMDAIATGINMLGDELEQSTISRDYFSNIYNAVSEILIVTNLKGKITDLNKATEKILNITNKDYKNVDLKKLISNKYKDHRNVITDMLHSNKPYHAFETVLSNTSGNDIPVDCSLSKITDHNNVHQGYLFIAKDITEQKNKEIHELNIIIAAQERERKRLAFDLHDSLGQEVNAIKMYLNTLLTSEPYSKKYLKAFETCTKLVDNSIETIRTISFDLLPKTLENGGLISALKELIKKLKTVCVIEYTIDDFKLNLKKEVQVLIYRVIQEFLNNSLKHSQCTNISISLTKIKKEIKITIKDNGKGFDINTVEYGNGIYNIKSRLEAIKAKYDFRSEPNFGTNLSISIKQT